MLGGVLDAVDRMRAPGTGHREIIVVDAGSTDRTRDLALSRGCTVLSAKPGFVAASRNLGAERASGDVLVFIDADCELPAGWLDEVISQLASPHVAAVGSRMQLPPGPTTWVERCWYRLAHATGDDSGFEPVNWLPTLNIAVRKDVFVAVGGFDPALETCEDVDIGYRLAAFGELRRLNSHPVIHRGESKTLGEFVRREAWRSRSAIAQLRRHWRQPREVLSFAFPIAAAGLMLGLAATAVLTGSLWAAALALLVPVLLTLRRQVPLRDVPACSVLMAAYLIARSYGTFRHAARLQRTVR